MPARAIFAGAYVYHGLARDEKPPSGGRMRLFMPGR